MTRSSETLNARLRCLGVAPLLLSPFASAASETNYRLAGIVAATGKGAVALIELPDGRQRLFREGDTLGDGRISEITAAGVRVELVHEDLLLRLRGSPILVASARAEVAAADDETEPAVDAEEQSATGDEEGEIESETERSQQVSASEMTHLLTAIRDAGQGRAGAQSSSAEALRGQLNESLEIPSGARITEVDRVSVST